jgi:hypothetical protein
MKNYAQIQQKIEVLNDVELAEVIDFIDFIHHKKTKKNKRLDAFKALQNANVSEKFGDALAWQKEVREDVTAFNPFED